MSALLDTELDAWEDPAPGILASQRMHATSHVGGKVLSKRCCVVASRALPDGRTDAAVGVIQHAAALAGR